MQCTLCFASFNFPTAHSDLLVLSYLCFGRTEGCEYSQFNGKFMCFNSCLYNGGQGNKKPLFLIITLERPLDRISAVRLLKRVHVDASQSVCPVVEAGVSRGG
ncbi:unnamed protein product [Protopolystoma xenopodis]|uniref:Uncharacterized protein n=1 Tax=Protopolystoma xenopodis TaxID=117903 RepID=A0A448XCF8_9PLAT|nr:unnamed protein product [Protopolystoma xenopodis]